MIQRCTPERLTTLFKMGIVLAIADDEGGHWLSILSVEEQSFTLKKWRVGHTSMVYD